MLKVTVCQLADDPAGLAADWDRLVDHVRAAGSRLVLLPEMAFYPWIYWQPHFDPAAWDAAVTAHDRWEARLAELAPARVLGSRPVTGPGPRPQRLNQGFIWEPPGPSRLVHTKSYLPDEAGFWEASWYGRGDRRFEPAACGPARIGFLICTELWFMQHARAYGRAGVQILANPRATERQTVERWLTGGRVAAIVAGAYCLSSNRVNTGPAEVPLGGQGWVVDPEGQVLAVTSAERPFVTVDLDLTLADAAKQRYPRYVPD